jgi:hypothetical protein
MRFVPAAEDTEILSDPTDRDASRRAKLRMKLCVASPEEVELYEYDPNGARRNTLPAIPSDDYGTMTDD